MIPKHLRSQVDVQTLGGTSIGDIVFSQEKDLANIRAITAEMEKELNEHINSGRKTIITAGKTDLKKKKGLSQKEKKRKREKKGEEEETEEDPDIENGEKIFLKPKTSKASRE